MQTGLRASLLGSVAALGISAACVAVNVALLGEIVIWPSAIGAARDVELTQVPVEAGTRFAASQEVVFGNLQLGNGTDTIIALAFEGGASPKLWLDQDNDEDLINDTSPEWTDNPSHDVYAWIRSVEVSYLTEDGDEHTAEYIVYVAAYRRKDGWDVVYTSYCLRKGLLWTEDGTVAVWLGDMDTDGVYDDLTELTVIVDADGDSAPSIDYSIPEIFYPAFPFEDGRIQVLGSTYTIESVTPDGRRMAVARAEKQERPLPHITIGSASPEFETVALDGQSISTTSLLGKHAVLLFAPISNQTGCSSCSSSQDRIARICELAESLKSEPVTVVVVSTTLEAPELDRVDCSGVPVALVWDRELLRVFRPRLDWLIVLGPDGTILGKDSVRPVYDAAGNVAGGANQPLSTFDILTLIFGY